MAPIKSSAFAYLIVLTVLASRAPCAAARDYEVGPGKALENVSDVPWESLEAGDTVLIHWRPEAYKGKFVICRAGTAEKPITVRGVPGPDGQLPMLDGRGATHRAEIDYWNADRCVIKVGGARKPADMMPAWIVIENLDVSGAREQFSSLVNGKEVPYVGSASCIYFEKCENFIVRNCILHDSANGFFTASQTKDGLVEGCHIYGNGLEGNIYVHNNYTHTHNLTFQFNHFAALRQGCSGNNLKDRSSGTVVRYNWIEAGNRQLDLVEGGMVDDPRYRETFVYGNILIEHEGEGNPQMVHYGGDNNNTERYRKGTLYLYNNTCVSTRLKRTTLLRLSTNDETCDMRNNIVFTTAAGDTFDLLDETGTLKMTHNWLKEGIQTIRKEGDQAPSGKVEDDGTNIVGAEPGFVDLAAQDFHLAEKSPCIGAGADLAPAAKGCPVEFEYVKHQKGKKREPADKPNIGAY
jgi:hypothetical protein